MAADVYKMVTDRIIAELEKGKIPWEKPWTGTRSGAYNKKTVFFTESDSSGTGRRVGNVQAMDRLRRPR